MDHRDIDEANQIIDFRERTMTWKHWAIIAAVNLVVFGFFSIIVK